ncbi:MAG TPA: MCP four helix bundle domain-containing protein, partial [Actinoplanes sp.]
MSSTSSPALGPRHLWGDLRVGVKITTAVLVALGVAAVATIAALIQVGQVRDAGHKIYSDNVAAMGKLSDIRDLVRVQRINLHEIVVYESGSEEMTNTIKDLATDYQALQDLAKEYRAVAPRPE